MTARTPPSIGILHLGLGAFHRAHQAPFTQDAIAASGGEWGIEAVSMRSAGVAKLLAAQGNRYTLIERAPGGPSARQIDVIRRATALPGQAKALAHRMADPALHIVTLTVTEKGYGANGATRQLNRQDATVAHDLATPGAPMRSVPGLLTAGLAARRAAGVGGLTVMSCDNLTDNGALLGALVQDMAQEWDRDLARWIRDCCTFPSSMVDRITPATTAETVALTQELTGRADPGAVETEPFRQWVIEDRFAGPHPDWAAAGAELVTDVAPYEMMKLRMLNGAHSLLAYLGVLAGLDCVRDVMASPALARQVQRHMAHVATTLPAGLDTDGYAKALISRFENPAIAHRCVQIAMDGSQKLPQRLFAPAQALLVQGGGIDSCALAVAAWIKHLQGRDDQGGVIPVNDPLCDPLRAAADRRSPADGVAAIAAVPGLAHQGLLDGGPFRAAVINWLDRLDQFGVRGALDAT